MLNRASSSVLWALALLMPPAVSGEQLFNITKFDQGCNHANKVNSPECRGAPGSGRGQDAEAGA